jgi:RNA polymerase sigma-70 factor (sigma-E family)
VNSQDREEFAAFMTGRWPGLVRLGYGLTGDRSLAEELAQTALASACTAWRRVRRADDPDAYVRKILVNAANRRFREQRRSAWGREPVEVIDRASASAGDPAHLAGARSDLATALRGLPPRQRAVIVLRYWADLSDAQIADVLGCSEGTVRSQAWRALEKLRLSPALRDENDPGDVSQAPSIGGNGEGGVR